MMRFGILHVAGNTDTILLYCRGGKKRSAARASHIFRTTEWRSKHLLVRDPQTIDRTEEICQRRYCRLRNLILFFGSSDDIYGRGELLRA